jgi:hypothetical protein
MKERNKGFVGGLICGAFLMFAFAKIANYEPRQQQSQQQRSAEDQYVYDSCLAVKGGRRSSCRVNSRRRMEPARWMIFDRLAEVELMGHGCSPRSLRRLRCPLLGVLAAATLWIGLRRSSILTAFVPIPRYLRHAHLRLHLIEVAKRS